MCGITRAGNLQPFLDYVTQAPADLNVQCLEDSELIQISYSDLQPLYIKIPKLERFSRIIVQRAFVAAQKRIVNNLSLPAMERYLQFRKQYPPVEQRVPQYMVASYLGITKEFLSKIRTLEKVYGPGAYFL